ncbi:MAG: hypothetical protein M3Y87_25655 [Myxococcota bacterium]|nr:hypothetical protein [Myxococcota bacterium]
MLFRWISALLLSLAIVAGATDASAQAVGAHAPRASDVMRTIERSASRVQHLLGETRASGDAERASCVDRRLSQITATLRLALERTHRAHRHDQRGDQAQAERERALITRLESHVRSLERDARACIDPELEVGPDRTRVTVIIDPSVPTDAIVDPFEPRSALAGR